MNREKKSGNYLRRAKRAVQVVQDVQDVQIVTIQLVEPLEKNLLTRDFGLGVVLGSYGLNDWNGWNVLNH